jgi:hypothetical protein
MAEGKPSTSSPMPQVDKSPNATPKRAQKNPDRALWVKLKPNIAMTIPPNIEIAPLKGLSQHVTYL